MDVIVKDRTFDSGRAGNSNANEPLIELKTSITDIIGACVVSANVPFTYNVFDSSNNTFAMSGTTITIPSQTPNAISLPYVLSSAYTLASVTNAGNYGFFVDNTTSLLVFYNTAGTSFTLDFTASTAAYDQLGFSNTTYSSTLHSTLIAAGNTIYGNDDVALTSTYHVLVSPYTVNLSGPAQMYVHCRLLGPAMNGAVTNDSNSGDIIGDFRVNTNYQGTITYENTAPVKYDAQIPSLRKVQLYLTTGSSTTPLDLRGAKWQVKIRFFCRKKEVDTVGQDGNGNRNVSSVSGGGDVQMRDSNARSVLGRKRR